MIPTHWAIHPEVREALHSSQRIVALESTLISHGLPFPTNLQTAREAEVAVRECGAIPATIAIWEGRPTIGLTETQLSDLAQRTGTVKASRRDLPAVLLHRQTAGTTVSATMALAHLVGIRVFATGGIGGVHRDTGQPWDISSDLTELARTPVLVVCAGAKSILDLPRTIELLETFAVPVVGYQTDRFPAFYVRDSGLSVSTRVDSPEEAANLFRLHRELQGGGMLLAQPVSEAEAIPPAEWSTLLEAAETQSNQQGIRGGAVTPFLLAQIAELSQGRSLVANRSLIVANARLAALIAVQLP